MVEVLDDRSHIMYFGELEQAAAPILLRALSEAWDKVEKKGAPYASLEFLPKPESRTQYASRQVHIEFVSRWPLTSKKVIVGPMDDEVAARMCHNATLALAQFLSGLKAHSLEEIAEREGIEPSHLHRMVADFSKLGEPLQYEYVPSVTKKP